MWFRVDDTFLGHPKAVGISNDSLATWTRLGDWCAWQLTDGVFELAQVPEFAGDAADPDAVMRDLINRRLWESGPEPGRLQFHDWTDYNPSRAKVLAKRKADAERLRRWREKQAERNGVSNDVSGGNAVTDAVTGPRNATSNPVTGPRNGVSNAAPDPTRPDPTGSERVGEGNQGTDRNAPELSPPGSGAPADGWTPGGVLDRMPDPERPPSRRNAAPPAKTSSRHPPASGQLCRRCGQRHPTHHCPVTLGPGESAAAGDAAHGAELARKQMAERARPEAEPEPDLAAAAEEDDQLARQKARARARDPEPDPGVDADLPDW